jgi:hypothetical protein
MKATISAQNAVSVARWYGIAKFFPQTHPQTLEEISQYTTRYGATPDGPDSAPWMYQVNPETTTPQNWQPPLTVLVGSYYDPRTGKILKYGEDPANDLDPTSPAFIEPPPLS